MEDITKTIMFTANSIQNGQPTTIQYQTADGTILKQPKIEGQKPQEFPTFYTTSNGNGTINLAQLTTGDENKTCYIAQPISGYNYALVNQMQLAGPNGTVAGVATVDNQGRLQIVNKPVTNSISNISFKCDVCGLMFSHLTLLNHHKRIHTQATDPNANQETAIVVTQGSGVQGQTLVTESGQSLGQIQIVTTDPLDTSTLQQHQQQQQQQQQQTTTNEITVSTGNTLKLERGKCNICGTAVLYTPTGKRKNPKVRCENCAHSAASAAAQLAAQQSANENTNNSRSTQIFVAPDGDVKFEMSELNDNDEGVETQMIHVQSQQHLQKLTQQHNQQQQQQQHQHNHVQQSFPLKKRNVAASQQSVTKCNKCNGSGVVFVGQNQQSNTTSTTTNQTIKTMNPIKPEAPKPFQCNICGGTFSRYSSLWSHKKLHSGEKNFKCEICGLAFAKAVYLKNHSRIHTGEKPYKCNTCGMQFSQSPHLKNHERTHSGEKPYVCEVCDKGFARHATLWNHRRIHTGEKPYKCDICGSCFSQAAHLKNHAKVHSGEKPFKCDICLAAFADRFALKRHRGIHEKYGQTTPRVPKPEPQTQSDQQQQQQNQESQQIQIIHKMEMVEGTEDRITEPTEVVITGL